MNKSFFYLLLISCLGFGQQNKTSTYEFGQDGMELVATTKSETIIVSTFNAKMTIRSEIAEKIYALYLESKLETNSKIEVNSENANVFGKCFIRKKNHLTVIDFYYESVEWKNGLTEFYLGKNTNLITSDLD